MALKLQVPCSQEGHLPVALPAGYEGVIDEIRRYVGPNVRIEGDDLEENDVLVENFFGVNNRVPDVSRYLIGDSVCCVRHNIDSYHICNNRYVNPRCDISGQQLQQQIQQDGSIVLLLESPHKDEYQHNHINCPKAPAMGQTGIRIERCLGTVLSKIRTNYVIAAPDEPELIETGRHVILSNPIQFQTSLDTIHGRGIVPGLRNSVWRTLWNEGDIQQCFQQRLNTYNPSLIVNACTRALKSTVKCFVRETLPNVPLYETRHPSSWKLSDTDDNGVHRIFPYNNPNADDPP